uniref:C2H2-type domain-containing protein n=1 Tax=Clastoptera arizonana TaxID=38151 RepID=A0A1B6EG87_9HEMI
MSNSAVEEEIKVTCVCQYCSASFTRKDNCLRHEKNCGNNNIKLFLFFCPNCKACYNRGDGLRTHLKRCTPSENSINRRAKCLVDDCNLNFFHKSTLINHLCSHHKDISIKEIVVKKFSTFQEFFLWKESEEESTFSYFSQRNGCNQKTYRYYYCQHDGSAKYHSKRKTCRSLVKGRIKRSNLCIAKMKVWEDENKNINLEYFPTHSHHCSPEDFAHHPLPKSISTIINKQILEEVSPNEIFNNIINTNVYKNCVDINFKLSVILTKKAIRERVRKLQKVLRSGKSKLR